MGGAAATEGQDALNALGMDGRSFGFYRGRCRPAKVIKGAKKAAHYPNMRCSPKSLAWFLASFFFLAAASLYHEVFTVAQQAKANVARAEAEAGAA